jgi:hypothetical protein
LLVIGTPYPGDHLVIAYLAAMDWRLVSEFSETFEEDRGYVLSVTDGNRRMVFQSCSSPDLAQAFASARSARFEHGESGGAQ